MIYSAFCAEPASRVWFDIMSVTWVWSSPVFRLVLYAAWAALEQCKLLSACGVSFQLLFHQVAFCGQLLRTMLCRSQYLRHDYVAISDRTRCYFHQKLLLCYFILSCRLRIKVVCFMGVLFASSLRMSIWGNSLNHNPTILEMGSQSTSNEFGRVVDSNTQDPETGKLLDVRLGCQVGVNCV